MHWPSGFCWLLQQAEDDRSLGLSQWWVASRMCPSSLGLPKQKVSDSPVHCHWHVLYDPPERNVLKILKIASKKILLSDGKTDVLMTSVALSQKNSDQWSYLPRLKKKKRELFVLFCIVRISGGCLSGFFWLFLGGCFVSGVFWVVSSVCWSKELNCYAVPLHWVRIFWSLRPQFQ